MKNTKRKQKIRVLVAILTFNCESKIPELLKNVTELKRKIEVLKN